MILIAEDNPLMKKLLRTIVADLDEWIVECADGEEACRLFEQHCPNWVLMDWEMKRMNGLEATRLIVEKYPQAKILMVTTHNEKDLRQAALEAGAKGFVTKDNLLALRPFLYGNAGSAG